MTIATTLTTYDAQNPQIVSSLYSQDEIITAAIVLNQGSYLLDASGHADCTAMIQAALDDCAYTGGGVVWLPAGYYRVTGQLKIPTYVTLRGDWQDPDTISNPAQCNYGTILIADLPTNDTSPLIYMSGAAGVRGLTIYYPSQSLSNIQQNAYAIYNEGQVLSKADRALHTIKDITMINAFKGIGLCDTLIDTDAASSKAEQSYILNVKGTFLDTGIYNFNSSENGGTIGFTANASYWANFLSSPAYTHISSVLTPAQTTITETAIISYTSANGTALHIGDLESDYFSDISIDGYLYGIRVSAGARTTYYGDLFHMNLQHCGTGIQFDALSGFGVNIACSVVKNNTMDIRNNTNVPIKLAQVEYQTLSGSNIYQTSDDTLTETFVNYSTPAYGTTASRLVVFAPGDSATHSAQLQTTLNQVGQQGGGIVYLPAGTYTLDAPISVPANTELRGCAGSAVKPMPNHHGGTILKVAFGHNVTDPVSHAAITLSGTNAGIRGCILVYPEQTPNTPIQTGYAVRALQADGSFVANCAILGFSHGLHFETCDDYIIEGISFANFSNNITAKNCVGGTISRCLQNLAVLIRTTYGYSSWETMEEGTNTPAFAFTSGNLDCIILDGSTDQTVMHWYAYRPHDTITLRNGAEAFAFNYGAGGSAVDDVGTLIVAEDSISQMLSINSHQKNRTTVDNAHRANIRAFNRMTLHLATLVTSEDTYRSPGADCFTLVEPGVSLLSSKATATGYDLSSGGSIAFDCNLPEYNDTYDISDYNIMALDLNTAQTSGGAIQLSFNNITLPFDVSSSGEQTLYIALSDFGNNLSSVNVSTFSLEVDESVSSCILYQVRLLKTLPTGTTLTHNSNYHPSEIILADMYATMNVQEDSTANIIIE